MRAPAGIELLSEGSWNPGSVSGEWSPGGCGCGSGSGECSCGGSCGCKGESGGSCGGGQSSGEVPLLLDYDGEMMTYGSRCASSGGLAIATFGTTRSTAMSAHIVSNAGLASPPRGNGDSWQGHSPGVTVEPVVDKGGKPDPCASIITLHVWLDGAKSIENGCMPNYFTKRLDDLEGIDLESQLSEARELLEGKRFACPCRPPPGKCWLEFRIKVHSRQEGDDPGGPTPRPVEFDCNCPKKDIDPDPNREEWGYPHPGEYQHGPEHRFHICYPLYPTSPHTMAHEVLHALGLGPGSDRYTGIGTPMEGWEGTLMGDPHGTGVTQRDICAIAKANRACRVPAKKKGKTDESCCPGFDDTETVVEKGVDVVIPAETIPISSTPTTGPRRSFVVDRVNHLVAAMSVQASAAGGADAQMLW